MIPKVATGFGSYKDDSFLQKSQHIDLSMTGNLAYATPDPPLEDIRTAIQNFSDALAAMESNGKEGTLLKNQRRLELEELLETLALYVQKTGGNDMVVLQSSGFTLQKGRGGPIGILSKPADFKVEPGPVPGSVKISFKAIAGANTYLFQYSDAPANGSTVWQNAYSGKSRHILEGLTSGQQYAFRACGIGADPTLVYSDVISSFVL
ncbi:MAG: fibronectin type III domain-containing protein [Ilyomonas sp.]